VVVLEVLQRNLLLLVRHPLATVIALVLGGTAGFLYSYLPLHSSKLWQIEYLESRVQTQRSHIERLEAEVQQAAAERDGLPDPGELAALKTRLAEVEERADDLEKERKSFQGKVQKLTRSRDAWRKKHGAAETRIAELEEAAKAPPTPEPALAPAPGTTPAAPSPWPAEVRGATPPGLAPSPDAGPGSPPDLR